jgi:hypothetical protein
MKRNKSGKNETCVQGLDEMREEMLYLKSGYRALAGERAWKAMGDSLQVPRYLSIVDHYWTIRARKQRTEIGKYSFVNKSNY